MNTCLSPSHKVSTGADYRMQQPFFSILVCQVSKLYVVAAKVLHFSYWPLRSPNVL